MIQRIQSLLLLSAVICAISMFFIPSFYLHSSGGLQSEIYKTTLLKTTVISGNAEKDLLLNWPLLMSNSSLIILYLVAIFSYRNRKRQANICNMSFLFQLCLAVLIVYDWKQLTAVAGKDYSFFPNMGVALLIISIVLIFFARRFILKDEALVRSADRLR